MRVQGKTYKMSGKTKKQFGVWMDSQHAIIVGREDAEAGSFKVLGHSKNSGVDGNSNENAANNQERTVLAKFFKDITSYMPNVDEVHVTGTGTAQEQFIKYLGETPQYKNATTEESTSNKMSEEKLVEYFSGKFN